MKKFITLMLAVAGCIFASNAQVIQLEKVELSDFEPTAQIVFEDYANGIIKVKENHAKQFQDNAINFLVENFDIYRFMREAGDDTDEVRVTLKSSNGMLLASYNKDGQLVKTYQKFKDVPLPPAIRNQVYAEYEGWTMTKNKYVASGLEDNIDKERYLVHLERGNDKEKIKITPKSTAGTGVAVVIEKQ
ncbi:hypothetical protein NE848_12340 [Gramella jeungdoensis]|uniref:Nicotinate-nucleotide adenylyltransferase n=1 Tax=Gramella jeungdoensis TaxID=708091 RepID=A0ABT0Z357_9FLAO|nr:hypothetical protein [Gramella jeungdoensis]MCM8570173.1 hypothetical protein [Gramella jeungdoensis]